MRRAGAVVLAVVLLANLGALTYWRFDELSARRAVVLAALWALGAVALALLVRAARAR